MQEQTGVAAFLRFCLSTRFVFDAVVVDVVVVNPRSTPIVIILVFAIAVVIDVVDDDVRLSLTSSASANNVPEL